MSQKTKQEGGDSCAPAGSISLPKTWAEYRWPKWVPENVREQLREFWSEEFGRSPRAWQESFKYAYANHPILGGHVRCKREGWQRGGRRIRAGRWVPMWNNIGRLICRNGEVLVQSTCDVICKSNDQDHK